MTPMPRRAPVVLATILATILAFGLTACASTDSSSHGASDTSARQGAGAQSAWLRVPATDADGNFAAVDRPPSTGELAKVHVRMTEVARLDSPTALVSRPHHPTELWIAERAGRIFAARRSTDGTGTVTVAKEPFLDVHEQVSTDGEEGLLGLAFDPAGKTLYFTMNVDGGDTHLMAVDVTDSASWPQAGKPRTILVVDQPDTPNHKGGDLAFGPDGYLYLGLGDGGGQGDPDQRAQDPKQLLGKMLRIDPAHPTGSKAYGIPDDNPFASGGGAPEVWLTGLRNPWRFSFDAKTHDLWIGDVGQDAREEVDRLPFAMAGGANLGWSGYEGTKVYEKGRVPKRSVPPLYEELHDDGSCAVTGGFVYRGTAIPGLEGAYVLADLCRRGIRVLRATTPADAPGAVTDHADLDGAQDVRQIISFGTDADNELYALSLTGAIWRIDKA